MIRFADVLLARRGSDSWARGGGTGGWVASGALKASVGEHAVRHRRDVHE